MKKAASIIWVLGLLILQASCSPSPTLEGPIPTDTAPQLEVTANPTTLDILKTMDPTFEIFFDGESCKVEGPSEISTGEYFFILHNQTDLPATLWLANYFGEGSYENHFIWREENCGGQGSHCEDSSGNNISYSKVSWLNAKKQASEGIETYYKLYELTTQRQHLIWVDSDAWWAWLCAPIQVTN